MSFGIIHRDVNGDWEKSGWSCGYFIYNWRFLLTLRRSIHLQNFREDEETIFYFK